MKYKHMVISDTGNGYIKTNRKTYEYYVKEFGRTWHDETGRETRKLSEVFDAYNPQGYLIATRVGSDYEM